MFTTAAILAVLMNYPVRCLSRYLPRGVAIALVVLSTLTITLAAITLLGYQILTQGSSLLQSLTAAIQTINLSNLLFGEYLRQMDRPPLAPNEPEE
ncbi:AI-2E family transporter [Leptothermofonsia sichuanensis E412]|uniref:hypothetical protein n=1 Tax=Leptothermofonsia sichuanensis TaxID=2917832 RepID=UPI001CA76547|nr:hypothetical protein [Leptothermofonsia sichuanensis]QZZ22457.1 AI-2E family transporter [Leptothermofonsia sichuanensis E412]